MPELEDRPTRLKRLHMRSIRRGIKEMDLILTAYSEARLAQLDDVMLDDYEALLNENDQDLYMWVSGQTPTPERFSALVGDIASTLHRN